MVGDDGSSRETHIATEFLPEYLKWLRFNPGHSLSTYVRPTLSLEMFFAVASIVVPNTKLHQGGLFLADDFNPERFENWMRQVNGDMTKVERVMNHRHVRDISASLDNAPFEVVQSAGGIIQNSLIAWLSHMHPELQTTVEMTSASDDVEVTFFVVR